MNLHDLYEKPNHAAFCFGRLNPPTLGHKKLLDTVAQAGQGNYYIFLSQTQKLPDNPLSYEDKVKFVRAMFPEHSKHVITGPGLNTIMRVAAWVYNQGVRSVSFVAGSDRLEDFKALLDKYNGYGEPNQEGYYNFDNINYVSSGERDPDAEGVAGYSASKARAAVADNDFNTFKEVTGAGKLAQQLYDAVKSALDAAPVKKQTAKKTKVTKENVNIGREWMSDTEIDQYIPEPLQQDWRELLGYDENGNTSKYWAFKNEPDMYSDIGRVQILSAANLFFRMKKIPLTAFDFKDIDDELEWLVQVGQRQDVAEGAESIVAVIDGVRSNRTYNDKDHAHNSLSKLVSYGKAKVAELYINGEKVEHFELNKKYLDFEPKQLDSTMSEAGPFSYGAKKPRKGSVADLAAKKRQEQEKDKQPVEPRDHMVGVARVKKDVEEGFTDDLDDIYALHPGQEESETVAIKIIDVDLEEFDDRWTALPMPYLNEFNGDLPLWDMEDLKMYPYIKVQRMTFDQYVKLVSNYINSDDMVNSVLNKIQRGVAEDFGGRKFIKPNFDFEWEEAERYPEFVKLGKDAWIELARKGRAVVITSAQGINNTDAADPDNFKLLHPEKQKRALAQLEKGTVEMPIVAVYSDGRKELVGGNTRLTAMMAQDGQATVWAFRVPGKQGVAEGIKNKAAAAALTGAIASPQAHGISVPAFNIAPAVYQTQIKPKQDQEASRKAGRAFPLSQQSKELMKKKDVDETIRKVKGGYRLISHKGKNLGTYPTHAGAERREQQVNYFKHVKEDVDSDNSIKDLFAQFLPLAAEYLGLEKLPKINLELILPAQNGQASFGGYNSNTKEITLAIANRHPVDIFRTLAHELVHFKQDSMGKLKEFSGETGSTEENQANTVSGIIMRLFNKAYPDAINAKVISTDSQDIEEDIVDDTVQYHDTLEPSVWQDGVLKPEIRNRLLTIAKKFIDSLNVDNFDAKDIVLTGSMANYNYTKFSDFDLHVITDYDSLECSKIANEFYQSKKRIWNRDYDIQINGHDVELYVEDDDDPPVSGGVYSILDNKWIKEPTHQTPDIDLRAVRAKTREYIKTIHDALNGHLDAEANARLVKKLRDMRTSGLERAGEFSVENLAYKTLRNAGILDRLSDLRRHKITTDLSL